jgi:hypothetical protein
MRNVAVAVGVLLLAPVVGEARLIENWPYEKLFKEADLVVIASATCSADSGGIVKLGGWSVDFVGVKTTFIVKHTLKGEADGQTLKVRHFRLKEGVLVENGPLLVRFRTERGLSIRAKGFKGSVPKPDYLLFLKRNKDGRYEPVSGRIDPRLSVKEIYAPLPRALDNIKAD